MARARNIKPGFYKNEDLAECSIWARFIFPGLWMLADREGRLEDRPKRIKAELLAFDSQDVSPLLDELQARGFLVRYQNSEGSFIQISKFSAHQTPHYSEKSSVIKPPQFQEIPPDDEPQNPENSGKLRNTTLIKRVSQPPDSLIPDSLIPDSLIPESLSTPPPGGGAAKPPTPKRATQLPPDFAPNETGVSYAEQRRVAIAVELESFRNWHSAKGTTMKDWQAAWRTWCDKAVEFGRANGARAAPARTESIHDKRARAMEELTGQRRSSNERNEIDITGEAVRVA